MKRYRTLKDGERLVLRGKGGVVDHKMSCCHCKLTHFVRLRILPKSMVELTAWRDNRATAARRRKGK